MKAVKSGYVYKYAIGSGGSENFATGLNLYNEQRSQNRDFLEVPALDVKECQFMYFLKSYKQKARYLPEKNTKLTSSEVESGNDKIIKIIKSDTN